ncbi:hypothetical protein BJV78DRAFT_1153805 [Lactifluus subvellereus]|nr:hypothetical protein BJV78DRAFT_1155307 [Lactifluus subvellereus]KAI0252233.1 hypothetical protein BJV78DRAFT_1153805 [Lactifluus subvellereus]
MIISPTRPHWHIPRVPARRPCARTSLACTHVARARSPTTHPARIYAHCRDHSRSPPPSPLPRFNCELEGLDHAAYRHAAAIPPCRLKSQIARTPATHVGAHAHTHARPHARRSPARTHARTPIESSEKPLFHGSSAAVAIYKARGNILEENEDGFGGGTEEDIGRALVMMHAEHIVPGHRSAA